MHGFFIIRCKNSKKVFLKMLFCKSMKILRSKSKLLALKPPKRKPKHTFSPKNHFLPLIVTVGFSHTPSFS